MLIWCVNRLATKRYYCVSAKMLGEYLDGRKLLNCSGNLVDVGKALRGKNIIAYYFSASWCNPCKMLLPKIKQIYEVNKTEKAGLEIIFISSDEDEENFLHYFKERHGGWYAVPFGNQGAEILRRYYGIEHIPQIVVVNQEGTIISRRGTVDVNELGANVLIAWNSAPV